MSNQGDSHRRIILRIRGVVQGVGYRVNARRVADSLGIDAHPENLHDGSVRVVATGSEDALERFRAWCENGPPSARVESVVEENET